MSARGPDDPAWYRITDGRHRAVASMIAGRKTILAKVRKATDD